MIRKMLLDTGCVIENENLEKYIKIVTHPDTEGYVERHHILPVSYFRLKNIPIDNSSTNIVTLSAYNHLLAHYYLYGCISNPMLRSRLAFAFVFMQKSQQGLKLKSTEAEFLAALPAYSNIIEDNYQFHSACWKGKRRSRESVERSIATRMKNKDVIYAKIAKSNKGKHRSFECKLRMSESAKRRDPSTFARGFNLTEEQKQHLREINLGKKQSEETKQKRRESLHKLQWFTNGEVDVRSETCPDGYYPGRTYKMDEQTKSKCSQAGKKWFNNGVKNTMAESCPEGFIPGRLKL